MSLSTLERFEKQVAAAQKWGWVYEQQPDKLTTLASTFTTPDTLKPIHSPRAKSAVHVGNKVERTPEREAKREHQSVEVLKAFLDSEHGYTDSELCAAMIGGSDGPRRRRYLRSAWGVSFNVSKDATTGLKRYSLSDKEHAKKVLAAGKAVDPLL